MEKKKKKKNAYTLLSLYRDVSTFKNNRILKTFYKMWIHLHYRDKSTFSKKKITNLEILCLDGIKCMLKLLLQYRNTFSDPKKPISCKINTHVMSLENVFFFLNMEPQRNKNTQNKAL